MRLRLPNALTPKSCARERVFRATGLLIITMILITLAHVLTTNGLPAFQSTTTASAMPRLTEARAQLLTTGNRHMVYMHNADILITTMAKAGSSSLWHWLYKGMTGKPRWSNTDCADWVHEKRSTCWHGYASYAFTLPAAEQVRILTDPRVLRVAIQRAPFERLVSAYKSKFTCEADKFKTDVHERESMVRGLLKAASLPTGATCLNMSDFADALDVVRKNVGKKGYPTTLGELDDHIKPQQFHLDEINYNMILDVSHLSDIRVLTPVLNRLPFRDMVREGIPHRHSSGEASLSIPEDAASKLYAFALMSKPGDLKFVPGAEPQESVQTTQS